MLPHPTASPHSADRHSVRCTICGVVFSRQEHLARHRKSHTREKPHGCPVCGKKFARQDVMSRHAATHGARDGGSKDGAAATRLRACLRCASCRVRCSRTEPCARCSDRKLACVYPSDASAGTPSRTAPSTAPTGLQESLQAGDNATALQVPFSDVTVVAVPTPGPPQGDGRANLSFEASNGNSAMLQGSSWPVGGPGFLQDQTSYGGVYPQSTAVSEQILDMLAVNWISPDYSTQMDWAGMFAPQDTPQPDANRPPFSFLFEAAASLGDPPDGPTGAVEALDTVEPDRNVDASRRYSTCGGSTNGTAHTVSDAPTSYVDGGEARAPFPARLRQQHQEIGHSADPQDGDTVSIAERGSDLVSLAAYNSMVHTVRHEAGNQVNNVDTTDFPSYQRIAELARLYFSHFHPVFPFIRRADFCRESRNHWILLLAVAVVGSKYALTSFESDRALCDALDLVLERRIKRGQHDGGTWATTPNSPDSDHLHLLVLQATVLNTISNLHSGRKSLVQRALAERYHLVNECNRMSLLSPAFLETAGELEHEARLAAWLSHQSRLRTGLMIWLLDFMAVYEHNAPALMQLVDAKGPMPCSELLWEAPRVEKIRTAPDNSVSLIDAIEMLYIEKRLPENLTEFGTVLLIHGILRRTKEAIKQTQTRLSSWIPSATAQQRTAHHSGYAETWPPATPILSRWRNSACDCLDILHWRANAKVAGSAGCEHPTVLHLHFSRIVLLCPTAHLHTLAALAGDPAGMANAEYAEARAMVLRWAIHDSYKARLSIIHAGSVFWHVRRYSNGIFIEPYAVYISTLVLWAYSISVQYAKLHGQTPNAASPNPNASVVPETPGGMSYRAVANTPQMGPAPPAAEAGSEGEELFFIHLDRPCDDEMVQTYIRRGSQIPAYMARVGNIMDEGAATKIVQEGVRLLSTVGRPGLGPGPATAEQGLSSPNGASALPGRWGVERSFTGILESLVQVMGGQSRQ